MANCWYSLVGDKIAGMTICGRDCVLCVSIHVKGCYLSPSFPLKKPYKMDALYSKKELGPSRKSPLVSSSMLRYLNPSENLTVHERKVALPLKNKSCKIYPWSTASP